MTAMTLRDPESSIAAIEQLCDSGASAQELLEEVSERVDRVVPNDGSFLAATDPETMLTLGAGLVTDLPLDQCKPTWDYEFLVPDYLKFRDIASSGRVVADLHDVTGGNPDRSARWREFRTATGFASEVRGVFSSGGATWGIAQFDRLGDAPRFSAVERAWLERIAPAIARGLRRALTALPANRPTHRGPGIVIVDERGSVVSATREAAEWIADLGPGLLLPPDPDFRLPLGAPGYAARVREAAAAGHSGHGQAPMRLRTQHGVWLLMHASMLQGTDHVAMVIEPAKASEVAPLIVEAYGLTARELDVTRAIARGLGTAEIAADLVLSAHTVRDHVKAVFEKVGVSSRGELVAKVFAEHYSPPAHA